MHLNMHTVCQFCLVWGEGFSVHLPVTSRTYIGRRNHFLINAPNSSVPNILFFIVVCRKRWASSCPYDNDDHDPSTTSGSSVTGAPSAKRSKHSSQGPEPQPFKRKTPLYYTLGDRKRAYTAPSYSMSPDSKRSRLSAGDGTSETVPLPARGKVSLPDFECDGESEVSELSEAGGPESGTSSKTSSRAPSECTVGWESDGLQQRSLTPPVRLDETEMNRKVISLDKDLHTCA